jgi:integrase
MRVHLKGIHTAHIRLADGTLKVYYYAYRGGPRLVGEPGSPEFFASFHAAIAERRQPNPTTFHSIIAGYKASKDFEKLEPRTQRDYLNHIARIENDFGDLPIDALDDPRVTKDFLEWRDGLAISPRQADYSWTVLMRLVSWARARGLTLYRPPDRVEPLYRADRADKIWRDDHIAAFMAVASEPLQRALVLALETGQRQGDLLALPWSAFDGTFIRLRQNKTRARVNIPVTRRLRAVLDNTKRVATTILTDRNGRPWGEKNFQNQWRYVTRKVGINDLHFHDLRGTAVTRLAEAGCTTAEIAAITGHSMRDVGRIFDRYLARTDKLAVAAIAKLERGANAKSTK